MDKFLTFAVWSCILGFIAYQLLQELRWDSVALVTMEQWL
jgi:hypothetical protein